ncbi:MAG: enoyl-CoA hydratase/isomerase family protein [Blastocatellales bacterium]
MDNLTETINCELHDSFAVVTIRGKDENNALDSSAVRELTRVFSELKSNLVARSVILAGADDHAFSTGVDIEEISTLMPEQARVFARAGQSLTSLIENLGKPVIAAMNGLAFGAGCDLALACTWRIADSSAKFAYPEVSYGVLPEFGGASRLPRLIGKSRALEMILTGDQIGADEALRIGLVNRVARSRDELMAVCEELAISIGHNAPLAIRYALEAVNHATEVSIDDGLRLESSLFGLCFATEDVREGTSAFLEKRPPVFRGK